MALAEHNKEKHRIDVHASYTENDLLSQIPGARFERSDQVWTVPLSWASCIVLRALFGGSLEVGPALHAWTWMEYRDRVKPAMELRNALVLPADDEIATFIDAVEEGLVGK